ncbi:hypothetical protein FDE98_17845 [Clostridium sporogenes]|uniref:Uncharacterized protein n=1 Tax=Clostridium sporogenes TaxID=1509 RepID=A0A7X5PDN2_CLOSG|nr:hypothetical protein [Clostridium sporogenes]AJD29126.1 hypothetical protein T258_4042 [Clostridium botulinum Prevot_594]NFL98403.1 hypothetical protein [Clostridium botulinum]NFP56271.1 hypothetical protein [Clostridium botulinum]NFQ18227.1 hypothetical protein [Clostridium sporogenes]NFQ22176.1 hypothetical protein [Clostridium sporogenes]
MLKLINKFKDLIITIGICGAIICGLPIIVTAIRNITACDAPVNGNIVEVDKKYMGGGRYIILNNKNCIAVSGDSINSKKKYYMVNDNIDTTVKDYNIVWVGKDYDSYKKSQER